MQHSLERVHTLSPSTWKHAETNTLSMLGTQKGAAQPLTAVPSPCLKVLYVFNYRQKYFTIKVTSHRIFKDYNLDLLNLNHFYKVIQVIKGIFSLF